MTTDPFRKLSVPVLLKKKTQNGSTEEPVLTRTPLDPGLPSGPTDPCNKGKTDKDLERIFSQ